MTRTQIINWWFYHQNNIRKNTWDKSIVPPVGRTYIFKTALGMKFFLVKRYLTGLLDTKIPEDSYLFTPELKLKEKFKIEEIYFIDYTSHNDTLTYVYANDVNSRCYDTCYGGAIDITKIPQYIMIGNKFYDAFNDYNIEILTLEELFVYKDRFQL